MKAPKINFRKDYDVFTLLVGNRPLNMSKVEKIKTDIESGLNLLPYFPILVYEKDDQLFIIDGQHRFHVSRDMELPVYYVETEEMSLYQIATMNSKQDKWTEKDFLRCYVELGNENYIILKELTSRFQVGIAVTAELLMYGDFTRRKDVVELFREGGVLANFQQETIDFLQRHVELFGKFKFFSDRNLIQAVQQLADRGLCDFEFLKEKLKQAPMMMDKQNSPKEYIYNLERIYNHKASTRKIIF